MHRAHTKVTIRDRINMPKGALAMRVLRVLRHELAEYERGSTAIQGILRTA
jgi:hypothetical protein